MKVMGAAFGSGERAAFAALGTVAALGALGALGGCGGGDACDPDAPNTICTIAGSGVRDLGTDGPATQSPMYFPFDVAVSPDGEPWVIDFGNYVVRAIDAAGDIRTVVGSGMLGDHPASGVERAPAREADLNHLADLAFRDGYLYLAAWHNSRIKRVRLSDMTLENVAGRGARSSYDGDGGPALDAAFDTPSAIAFDPAGRLTIMDQQNQVIRQVDGEGMIHTIAGRCVIDLDPICEVGAQPVTCPGSGKLTCGDPATTCVSMCNPSFSGDGGPALQARLAQPYGAAIHPSGHLVYDAAGNLLFADTDNHRIRRIDPAGTITTIAGTGAPGAAGDGGPALAAQLHRPIDLALGPDGALYISDFGNHCIRKIDPAGTIERVAGRCGSDAGPRDFAGDHGPPRDAILDQPFGITVEGDKLYIADAGHHRVRVANLRE